MTNLFGLWGRASPVVKTYDGHKLTTLLETAKGRSDHIALLLHGIFTDKFEKGRFDRLSDCLLSAGVDTLRFDFRGHGKSPLNSSQFTVVGALIDYLAALKWIHGAKKWKSYSVIGSSFGASEILIANLIRTPPRPRNVVLLNPVTDYKDVFLGNQDSWGRTIFNDRVLNEVDVSGASKTEDGFTVSSHLVHEFETIHPREGAHFFGCPTLVLHGDKDEKVPCKYSERDLGRVPNITLEIIKGAGHAFKDSAIEPNVHARIVEWVTTK